MERNISDRFTVGKAMLSIRQLILIITWMLLIAFLVGCAPVVTQAPTQAATEAATQAATQAPTSQLPEGAEKCETVEKGQYKCAGLSNHEITLAKVPDNVTPYLLPLPGDEGSLRSADKEGTGCIFVIVGNLAFYDQNNVLVEDFSSISNTPVTITYTFTDKDLNAFDECAATLKDIDPKSVTYQPVYFNDYDKKWKPFKSFEPADRTVTVYFTSWADQLVGGGTKP